MILGSMCQVWSSWHPSPSIPVSAGLVLKLGHPVTPWAWVMVVLTGTITISQDSRPHHCTADCHSSISSQNRNYFVSVEDRNQDKLSGDIAKYSVTDIVYVTLAPSYNLTRNPQCVMCGHQILFVLHLETCHQVMLSPSSQTINHGHNWPQ